MRRLKVLTITCSNAANYGARLQACALAEWLRSEGHDASVIDYRPWYMRNNAGLRLWGVPFRHVLSGLRNYGYMRNYRRRLRRFAEFSEKYIPLTPRAYMSAQELAANPPSADAIIAGSDQIWNVSMANGSDPAFFLRFADSGCRRISYAASIAIPEIPAAAAAPLRDNIATFDHVSVREESGARIVESLGLPRPQVTVDPVFLLPGSYWESMAAATPVKGKYILVYDFMRSRELQQAALRLKRLTGARIINVGARRLRYADRNFLNASPQEFLGLLRGADCVLSNSFHGSVFAMIFGIDFLVVDREDGLNERMRALLQRYGLEQRLIGSAAPDSSLTAHIDYTALRSRLEKDIASSKEFLRTALLHE